jgi:PucR C-terminal helix-turn-helix domain
MSRTPRDTRPLQPEESRKHAADGSNGDSAPARAAVLARLRADPAPIIAAAAADTGEPSEVLQADLERILVLLEQPADTMVDLAAFRAVGGHAAEVGHRPVTVVDRYTTLAWAIWETAAALPDVPPNALLDIADRMLRGLDAAITAMAQGYRDVELRLNASSVERRRAMLDEVLAAPRETPDDRARISRRAQRNGIDPRSTYRVVLVASPGHTDEAQELAVQRLDRALSMSHGRTGPDGGIRLPQVLDWRGHILILASDAWSGRESLPDRLTRVLGDTWAAVDSGPVGGIEALSQATATASYALRVAVRLGRTGWLGHPDTLAIETAFLVDERQARAVVHQELGPLLEDERMGDEFIQTLNAWFESGQNMREVGRRMHLAPRTIAYRMERIEELLGHPLTGQHGMRLATALLSMAVLRAVDRDSD